MKKILIICALLLAGCDKTWQNMPIKPEIVRQYIKAGMIGKKLYPRKYPVANIKITDEKSFVKAAEAILFDVFGEDETKDERPYSVGYADGYWLMSGYLWATHGGVFYIMIEAKTGQVLYLTHSK